MGRVAAGPPCVCIDTAECLYARREEHVAQALEHDLEQAAQH
jgi:hypothetical protein